MLVPVQTPLPLNGYGLAVGSKHLFSHFKANDSVVFISRQFYCWRACKIGLPYTDHQHILRRTSRAATTLSRKPPKFIKTSQRRRTRLTVWLLACDVYFKLDPHLVASTRHIIDGRRRQMARPRDNTFSLVIEMRRTQCGAGLSTPNRGEIVAGSGRHGLLAA